MERDATLVLFLMTVCKALSLWAAVGNRTPSRERRQSSPMTCAIQLLWIPVYSPVPCRSRFAASACAGAPIASSRLRRLGCFFLTGGSPLFSAP